MSPTGNCDFLGLNVGDNQSMNQENQEVGIQAPIIPHACYSVRNCQSVSLIELIILSR